MRAYTLTHLSDTVLLRDLASLVARDRATTAALLAHIAEVDARRLYAPAGYESMHAYCVDALHLSEDAAYKRIQAARAARQFPALFAAVADGRLNLTAVCLLAPHLTAENVDELLAASVHQRNTAIRDLLAARFWGIVGRPRSCSGRRRESPNLLRSKLGSRWPLWRRTRSRLQRREFPRFLSQRVSRCISASRRARTTSCCMPRLCSAMPFRPGIRRRFSIARWIY